MRLLLLRNTLRRSPWQLVAVIFGALYGLGLLAGVTFGLFALSNAPVDLARTVVVLAGSATILGWLVLPLVVSGIDQTLDTARLVNFPIPLGQLLVGLAIAGVLGIPGIVTVLAALATAGTWWRHPLIAAVALVCAALAALTCVVGSRMVTSLSSTLTSGRRFREVGGTLILIPLFLAGPILAGAFSGIQDAQDALPSAAAALSWTPLGALWAVPSELALGHYGIAGLKFLIGIATLVVMAFVWRRALAVVLVTPARSTSRKTNKGNIGLFAFVPETPTGAVLARSLTYWIRDPRYSKQLILVPLMPALLWFYSSTNDSLAFFNAMAPIAALFLALAIYTDLSYDNTAFATHMSLGVTGLADRTGRALAVLVFAGPVVVIFSVVSVWLSGSWTLLPGILGLSIGILLSGLGLSSVSSATVVVPVPAPGDSPFKTPPGSGFTTFVSSFATWGILAVLVAPELILLIVAAATGTVLFSWLALAVGLMLGPAFFTLGIRWGAARLDRRAPELLESLALQK
nr:transporter [Cryobacterium roopkundense]